MDQRARAENTEPMLAAEPIENAEARQPADPIDSIEPTEPIDRIEPAEPIDRIEPLDPMLRMEPEDPAERDEPGDVFIAPFCCCCRSGCYWAGQQLDDLGHEPPLRSSPAQDVTYDRLDLPGQP